MGHGAQNDPVCPWSAADCMGHSRVTDKCKILSSTDFRVMKTICPFYKKRKITEIEKEIEE